MFFPEYFFHVVVKHYLVTYLYYNLWCPLCQFFENSQNIAGQCSTRCASQYTTGLILFNSCKVYWDLQCTMTWVVYFHIYIHWQVCSHVLFIFLLCSYRVASIFFLLFSVLYGIPEVLYFKRGSVQVTFLSAALLYISLRPQWLPDRPHRLFFSPCLYNQVFSETQLSTIWCKTGITASLRQIQCASDITMNLATIVKNPNMFEFLTFLQGRLQRLFSFTAPWSPKLIDIQIFCFIFPFFKT